MKTVVLILISFSCLLAGCAIVRPATAYPSYFRHEGRTLLLPFDCVLVFDGKETVIHSVDVPLKKKERIVTRLDAGQAVTIDRSMYRRELAQIWFFYECHAVVAGRTQAFVLYASWPDDRRIYEEGPNQAPEPTTTLVTPRADARVAPSAVVAHL